MKTLIIDNYDSFTFNLFQYLGEINGEPPIVVLNDKTGWAELQRLEFDNILISPGPGRAELEKDFGVCRQAILAAEVPVLGICLGHQGIAHLFGGAVGHAPQAMHGRLSEVYHSGDGLFAGLPSPFRAVRYHSLTVASDLPAELKPTAWTSDGVLMGLAHRTRPIWGVQFHPESICTEHGHALLRNFRDETFKRQRRTTTGQPSVSVPLGVESANPPLSGAETHSASGRTPSGAPPSERLDVRYRRIDRWFDPEAVFAECFLSSADAYWLDSALARDETSRFSVMGDANGPMSFAFSYRCENRRLAVRRQGSETVLHESVFDFLDREIARRPCDQPDLPFDFVGGFVGYLGYELKQECGGASVHRSSTPDAMFVFADRFIVFDRLAKQVYLVALTEADAGAAARWFDDMTQRLEHLPLLRAPNVGSHAGPAIFQLQHHRAAYLQRIEEARQEIDRGETYQVCLTNRLSAAIEVEPFALYRTLRRINPAPFSSFLKFGDLAVVSSSPERFLRVDRQRRVEAKPIKGTARRGSTLAEDDELALRLRNDEKTRAENLMIVDLLRNDLGRVCEIGSVRVPKLMEVETYATVHQLVSTIVGQLAHGRSAVDCVRAAFPGGSMTGAPKVRTMEIIDRLEGTARGIYSGAIGYLGLNGTTDLSIVIRTIVAANKQLSIGIGGAIVALSDPSAEFDEAILKGQALLRAIAIVHRGSEDGEAYRIEGLA